MSTKYFWLDRNRKVHILGEDGGTVCHCLGSGGDAAEVARHLSRESPMFSASLAESGNTPPSGQVMCMNCNALNGESPR